MGTESIVRGIYEGIDQNIQDVVKVLQMSPSDNASIWQLIQSVFEVVLPVGLMVAATFVLITLMEKAVLFQLVTIENVAKMFLLFIVGKVVLENSFEILGWIYQVVAGLIGDLGEISNMGASDADIKAMADAVDALSLWGKLMYMLQAIPEWLIMKLLKVFIVVIAYGRLIEIYVFTAVAPLPLATLVSETHSNIAKRFLQGYIAVCIQGLLMLISIMIYGALEIQLRDPNLNEDFMGGGIGFMVSAFVLLGVMLKSGSWAKTIVGTF